MSDTGPIACGVEISTDTTLDADLACEQGPALVIVADGVTLDLAGHTLRASARFRTKGPGILLRERADASSATGRLSTSKQASPSRAAAAT